MALDGILLQKIVSEMKTALPMRIQKIWAISNTEILFQTHGDTGKQQLFISCHSVYNRLLLTKRNYPTPNEPSNFVMVLRKYLEGATIESIEQAGLDRWCEMKILHHNSLGDLESLSLYVELMGKYANVILVSAEGKIIDALKRIPPFENSRRIVQAGAIFVPTPSQDKKDPYTNPSIDTEQSLTKQFAGFSPFLSKEVEYRMAHGQSFSSIMQEIQESNSLYIAAQDDEPVFHCIELTSVGACVKYPLFQAFDILYYHREEKDRIKQISGDIFHFCSRSLKHQAQKLPRLLKEFDDAKDCDKWREYGDLLFSYHITDTKGKNSIVLNSFEDDQPIQIPLDPKLDGPQNAKRCYNKYNKLKKGQVYLQEQIDITQKEIAYFEGLIEQLNLADFNTAVEIRQELIQQNYLKDNKASRNKKKKKKKDELPHISHVITEDGTSISYGRNNLQNDALTWHIAKKTEIWLHAKDYHGSHVVIHSPSPSEDTLRKAAEIAAYYSSGRNSSSVPVIWCSVKELKKIPGAKPGMVQLGAYKTIYIDPDRDDLQRLGIEEEA